MDLHAANMASAPAEEEVRLGPWRLRRGGGGRRAMAATLEGAREGRPRPEDIAAALARMREWGQRPVFQVRAGEEALDAALAAEGLVREGRTVILAVPSAAVAHRAADVAVIDCDGPLAVQVEIWHAAGVGPERLAGMARVATPKRYLLGRLRDRPAGAAFVCASGGVAMLNALEIVGAARRQGLGRRIVGWTGAWAAEAGAKTLAVAVDTENAPARALYADLGMTPAASYHYRVGT
jgi:N-acetylglutamate synthase